ncbi:hypothetical protein D9M72_378580 [compost metagenome]
MHAALGMSGGAGGIGQHAQRVVAGLVRQRPVPGGAGRVPGHRLRAGGRCLRRGRRFAQPGRHRQAAVVAQHAGIVVQDHMAQRRAMQRCHALVQLTAGKGGHRAAVLHHMGKFGLQPHRVGRDHHAFGAQDRVVGNDKLRAVLAEQQHPVARLDAADLLQVARHPFDLVLQLGVGDRGTEILDRGLVRIAVRRRLDVVEQAGARRMQRGRQAGRPGGGTERLIGTCGRLHLQQSIRVSREELSPGGCCWCG